MLSLPPAVTLGHFDSGPTSATSVLRFESSLSVFVITGSSQPFRDYYTDSATQALAGLEAFSSCTALPELIGSLTSSNGGCRLVPSPLYLLSGGYLRHDPSSRIQALAPIALFDAARLPE
jgi:hypothetical protein